LIPTAALAQVPRDIHMGTSSSEASGLANRAVIPPNPVLCRGPGRDSAEMADSAAACFGVRRIVAGVPPLLWCDRCGPSWEGTPSDNPAPLAAAELAAADERAGRAPPAEIITLLASINARRTVAFGAKLERTRAFVGLSAGLKNPG